ncbi:hypothetical protein NQ315_001723 [Exocentrus adspersus]|uniref:Uncharacterized protein n=1 Tax=Exocentrus adspersus TaxID=1586481 RepID=A0AAV8W9C0_9CUCU|nr:hypothetical protein NQ315_001723 [Exocentrus adspersus]
MCVLYLYICSNKKYAPNAYEGHEEYDTNRYRKRRLENIQTKTTISLHCNFNHSYAYNSEKFRAFHSNFNPVECRAERAKSSADNKFLN